MGSWVKHFNDGSTEIGSDRAISRGDASWSRGKLDDIAFVQLSSRLLTFLLEIPNTEWHQFDRYTVALDGVSESSRVARVLQAKVLNEHFNRYLLYNKNTYLVTLGLSDHPSEWQVTKEHIGKWLTATIYSSGKISAGFSEKGKFNAN